MKQNFLALKKKKCSNKIKVHKKYHYNEVDVEVNFEARLSVYFSFFCAQKEKKIKAKHFLTKFVV